MRINVAYGADEQFTKHVYISLFSILINMKKSDSLHCYFFTETPNKYLPIIKNLEKLFKNFKLNIILINEMNMKQFQTSGALPYLNYATYYRFCINLIKGIDRIVYLDSDIIVNSDISLLFKEDLNKKIVGVCSETPIDFFSSYINEIGLNGKKYFNAGMMLINLKKWNRYKVSEKCLNLLKERIYILNDQDVLNIVLNHDIKWLPGRYNVLTGYFPEYFGKFANLGFERNYYEDAIKNPKIIHYTGTVKPWKLLPSHPLRYIYGKNFWKGMSIRTALKGGFLGECLVVFIHDIEDFLFNYNMQQRIKKFCLTFKSLF